MTDSVVGAVFKVDLDSGAVTLWSADVELQPLADNCGPANVRLGANGIVKLDDSFYVANTDRAQIVQIPIDAQGDAGTPAVFLGPDCGRLFGLDDVRALPTGELVYAVNYANTVEAVAQDGTIRTLQDGAPLDGPASLEVLENPLRVIVTNSAFASFFSQGDANPSLVTITSE